MADLSLSNGINRALDGQLRDLRKQVSSISKSLADHGLDFEDLADDAGDFLHGARKNARRAVKQVKRDTDVVTRAAQKAPAATGTVLAVVAAVGFGLGYLYFLSQDD